MGGDWEYIGRLGKTVKEKGIGIFFFIFELLKHNVINLYEQCYEDPGLQMTD